MKKILVATLLFTLGVIFQTTAQKIIKKTEVKNTDFKKDFQYASFASNDNYLAWAETYTSQFYIYNLKTEEVEIMKQKKGRGPHEYIIISSLTLTADNKLIINDPQNIKLITYNIETGEFERDIMLDNLRSYRIDSINNIIFSVGIPPDTESLYYSINVNSWAQNAIDMMENSEPNNLSSTFKRVGYVAANNDYGIHLTQYYPNIYVINFNKEQVQKKIEFDKAETKSGGTTTARDGKKRFMAPLEKDVGILSTDVAFLPESDHSILILAEGKGEQRSYDPSQLRVYNFMKEKFTSTLDLGVNATKLTVNNNFLFVFSEEENAIFQYQIDTEK